MKIKSIERNSREEEKRRTNKQLVTFEFGLVDCVVVHHDDTQVVSITVRADFNLRAVSDISDYARLFCREFVIGVGTELSCLLDLGPRSVD